MEMRARTLDHDLRNKNGIKLFYYYEELERLVFVLERKRLIVYFDWG